MTKSVVPTERIEQCILLIRGQKVILDADLARLYGVTTKRFNEQVRRNADRFPPDFMFQLTNQEVARLRSQFATLERGRGRHRKYLPYAFTEYGAIMAANVLNSKRAIEVSIYVVRAFVKLKEVLRSHAELAKKLNDLENRYDHKFKVVFDAIFELMNPPKSKKKTIGFRTRDSHD